MSAARVEAASATPRSTVIAVVLATTIAQVASVLGIAVFPVIAPRLAAEMGVATATIGYQVSLIFGTAAFCSALTSFAATRWGACRTMQVGLGCCGVAMALALVPSLVTLAITSVLLGLAMTLMTPAAAHLLFRYSPPQNRNLIFSLKQTGVPLAWVIMALVAPGITLAFGWRWAIVAVLVVVITMIIALQPMRERWDDDRKRDTQTRANPLSGLRALWRYPMLRWLAIASLTLSFVQLCLGTFLVTMLVDEAEYSLVTAGVMLSLVQAAGVGGRILWGWVADRSRASLRVLQQLAATTAVCCIVMSFIGPEWPVPLTAVFFVVFGAAAVGWNGLFLAEVARVSPRGMVSVATSAAMTWNFAGILIGPALFATVFRLTDSYAVTYGFVSLVAFAGVGALAMCRAAGRREVAPS